VIIGCNFHPLRHSASTKRAAHYLHSCISRVAS
jgi:hypothetical protein